MLDALVETAAYVLRSLTEKEDEQLTLSLVPEVERVSKGKKDVFSTKKYADMRELKRHQANGELRRLHEAGFIEPVEGSFPRWKATREAAAQPRSTFALAFPPLVCLRLLGETDKERAMREALTNTHDARRFVTAPKDFEKIPNTPFGYWVGNKFRQKFQILPSLQMSAKRVCFGLSTKDDAQFLRLNWEVDSSSRNLRWFCFVKGGEFSPYYANPHLVIDWENDGARLKNFAIRRTKEIFGVGGWSRWINNWEYYFQPGLTWSRRSQVGLSIRVMPAGCIFSDKGPAIIADKQSSLETFLALCNSSAFKTLVSLQMVFGSYEVGAIQRTPVPNTEVYEGSQISKPAIESVNLKRNLDTSNEISHVFQLPALLQAQGTTLTERGTAWAQRVADADSQLAANQAEIDHLAFRLYGIDESEVISRQPSIVSEETSEADAGDEDTDEEETEQPITDHRPLTADLLSYALGCAMGRWDIRYATGAQQFAPLPDPFAPLPVCAPASLMGEDNLPLTNTPDAYPLEPDWDGILTDDEHHPDDIITRVRRVLDLIFDESSDAHEQEACQLLGVRSLRDYFRKTTPDGFWQHHIKRYSKSRRKAPIYWLLQSSKRNYALWIYYHRLTHDTLYKARINYVEPKLRLEANNLDALRAQRAASTATGREARQFEKAFDAQESFISELGDFRDKLKRAADLVLNFDLNDGVVLNIAPLRELVPWTEAKKYWTDLTSGKYEWSSISQQLRARGLVK